MSKHAEPSGIGSMRALIDGGALSTQGEYDLFPVWPDLSTAINDAQHTFEVMGMRLLVSIPERERARVNGRAVLSNDHPVISTFSFELAEFIRYGNETPATVLTNALSSITELFSPLSDDDPQTSEEKEWNDYFRRKRRSDAAIRQLSFMQELDAYISTILPLAETQGIRKKHRIYKAI